MKTVALNEVKDELSKYLRLAAKEEVLITRHGKPVARISPQAEVDRERVQRAVEQMHALRQRIGKLSLEEILSARDEGRA